MRDSRKLLPNAPTNHLIKQGMYNTLLKYGPTDQAKKTLNRPPFYKTASEVRTRKDDTDE